jgi:molybdate transport system permease protein
VDRAAWEAVRVSLEVAGAATLLVLGPAVAIGWLLARRDFPGKALVETFVALPLVLPPTAVGYAILRLAARDGWLGEARLGFETDLLLTRKGAVLAAAVMSLPLAARTARVAFEAVPARLEAMARSLGMSGARTFATVTLPLARRGLLAAAVLGFGRALGEFGATVVVAGNIPGRTQTLALAIFDDIQVGRGDRALFLLGVSALLAFAVIFSVERLQRSAA